MNYYWNWHWWSTILGIIHNALELQWDYDEGKTTLRSRCMMGVWQWCRRDTASHMSQKIRSTSRSVNPVEIRSFICEITEPATKTAAVNAESVSQNKNINVVYQRSDYLLTITREHTDLGSSTGSIPIRVDRNFFDPLMNWYSIHPPLTICSAFTSISDAPAVYRL